MQSPRRQDLDLRLSKDITHGWQQAKAIELVKESRSSRSEEEREGVRTYIVEEMSTQLQGMSTQPSVGHFRNERSSNKPRLLPKRPVMSTNAVGCECEVSQSAGQSLAPQSNHGVLALQGAAQRLPSGIVDLRNHHGSSNNKSKSIKSKVTHDPPPTSSPTRLKPMCAEVKKPSGK